MQKNGTLLFLPPWSAYFRKTPYFFWAYWKLFRQKPVSVGIVFNRPKRSMGFYGSKRIKAVKRGVYHFFAFSEKPRFTIRYFHRGWFRKVVFDLEIQVVKVDGIDNLPMGRLSIPSTFTTCISRSKTTFRNHPRWKYRMVKRGFSLNAKKWYTPLFTALIRLLP